MRGGTQFVRRLWNNVCLWKLLTLTAQPPAAPVCHCTPLHAGKERHLALRGCRWACENTLVSMGLSEHSPCPQKLSAQWFWRDRPAQTKAVPGSTVCRLLPPGLRHQLPGRRHPHSYSRQTEAFVSKGKYPYLGETLSYSYLNRIGSLWYLTLLLKWALGCVCRCSMHQWKLET